MATGKHVIATKPVRLTKEDLDQIELPDLNDAVKRIIKDSKVKSLQAFINGDNPTTRRNTIYKYWGVDTEL